MSGPLFEPFRALGYITDDVPFAVQRRGKETFVTVSVGRTWQVYNASKLLLVLVGPQVSASGGRMGSDARAEASLVGGTAAGEGTRPLTSDLRCVCTACSCKER